MWICELTWLSICKPTLCRDFQSRHPGAQPLVSFDEVPLVSAVSQGWQVAIQMAETGAGSKQSVLARKLESCD